MIKFLRNVHPSNEIKILFQFKYLANTQFPFEFETDFWSKNENTMNIHLINRTIVRIVHITGALSILFIIYSRKTRNTTCTKTIWWN